MLPLRLVRKNLFKHKLRFTLTVLSLAVAIFLLCVLRSLVVALDAGVRAAAINRVVVQSRVSLFVYLPQSYGQKIRQVEGVEELTRWNWFGGYYQTPANFFAQFATDADKLLDVYPEIEIVEGSAEEFLRDRKACLVGAETALKYGKKVGDSFPIIGALFPRLDGEPWDFQVAGIYRSKKKTIDDATMFFHWEYVDKAIDAGDASGPQGVGIYVARIAPDADPAVVMSQIDALFENGPQVVQSTTEAEFQAQFVSMVGNIPLFVSSIGGGVMIAILLAALNTMLMSAREQTRDVGVLKALGFSNGTVFGLLLLQAVTMCSLGGALGVFLAKASEPGMTRFLSTMFPGYAIGTETLIEAGAITLVIGVLAGLAPALRARGLSVVAALRSVR